MAITEVPLPVSHVDSDDFLRDWNPLDEFSPESQTPPNVLIVGEASKAHEFAARLIAKLIFDFPHMPVFVVPETPRNAEGEIDKTTEIMNWLGNLENRGLNPAVIDSETPIPLVYLSNVNDLYSETTLARMVSRSRFLGLIVVAVASGMDSESATYSNITGMFTHTLEV